MVVRVVRGVLEVALVTFVVGVITLALGSQLGPATGLGLYAVRSDSMSPALSVGDLVVVRRTDPATVRAGDVITIELVSGATVTHRVESVTPTDDGPMFTTRGDANTTADPVAARGDQLRGAVQASIPILGYLLAMLAMPSGIAALFSIGATLLTATWLLDEVESGDDEDELEELTRLLETERISLVP